MLSSVIVYFISTMHDDSFKYMKKTKYITGCSITHYIKQAN